ncbi:MAG: class I SAM-dependent methyltransferase [Candidatus Andersenbacteria bacterium]|nr:class I SAM-dependent methyltransferase [Candidatus Andersenbacteria bacterium]
MPTTNNKTTVKGDPQTQTVANGITGCRVCHSQALTNVLSLGNQYVSDFVDDNSEKNSRTPLELVLCDAGQGGCGLLQLRHTTEQQSLYRNYWYRSGINQTMRDALAHVVKSATNLVHLNKGDTVLDIGSNDNTLLKAYNRHDMSRIGFEPATNLMPYAQHPDIRVINDFFAAEPFQKASQGQKARIITSIAMFYDLEDPNRFTADIATSLADDGLWIIQMAYLPTMLLDNIFDNICHEHLEYYSLLSLENLLARHNLKVIDVELNDVNGGSYRIYITHTHNDLLQPPPGADKRIATLRDQEKQLQLDTVTPYKDFAERVGGIKEKVVNFIHEAVKAGKQVYVYGASTKGNTLLQYFNLDHTHITAAAERNPDKWGKKTVGTHIPIISEEEARAAQPDYFLVLPWHFMPEFIKREQAYLQAGGHFIAPLPEFKVIGKETGK